jgi:high-affinity iron transporter
VTSNTSPLRRVLLLVLLLAGLVVAGVLVWQGIVAGGNPDPTTPHLTPAAAMLNTAILVLREGLEAILVLAALTASLVGGNEPYQRPVALGAGLGVLATLATWFIAIAVLNQINAPALDLQAATGLLAIVVLLVVMNWFFHKLYWTGWISGHTRRRRELLQGENATAGRVFRGLALLGLASVYREGFEVVLFLQSIRLQVGTPTVLAGVAAGAAFTLVVGALTFLAHRRLPYKRMLVLTGILLGVVLVVMVGENIQEMQLAGWIGTTPVALAIPGWMGLWFAVFPNVETLAAQSAAALAVIGSYLAAEYVRVWRPRWRGQAPARRADVPPTQAA